MIGPARFAMGAVALALVAVPIDRPRMYRVPEVGNATAIEILWSALGALGVLVALTAAALVERERRAAAPFLHDYSLRRRRAMHRVWSGALRREIGRILQNGLVLGLGIYAMDQPPLTRPTVTTGTGLFITGVIFVWISITIGQSISDYITRHAVVDIFGEGE